MNKLANYIVDTARAEIHTRSQSRKLDDREIGYLLGCQRIIEFACMSPKSLDIAQLDYNITWARSLIMHNEPSETEKGIADAYGDVYKWLKDYHR